jgi:hypothetical protein
MLGSSGALCGFLGVLIVVLQPGEGVWHWAAPLSVIISMVVSTTE